MKLYKVIAIFFLFTSTNIFSQQNNIIYGTIKVDNVPVSDAAIELQVNNMSKYAISNKKGSYKFSNLNLVNVDSITIKVNNIGYKTYTKVIKTQPILLLDIELIISDPLLLEEVVITSKEKIIITANKSSYKIDQKDFIKQAKATEALGTVPNVYYNKASAEAIVDGKLVAKIFLDGIETMPSELENIEVADIDRVEVMNNPSARYGTDFSGAVINVITKKITSEFIKGNIGGTLGLFNNFWSFSPGFSYKKGRFTLKSNLRYLENYQRVDNLLYRNDNNTIFTTNNTSNSIATQPYAQTRIKIDISTKSNLTITNSFSGYKFNSKAKGFSILSNQSNIGFSRDGINSSNNWNIGSVYSYVLKENNKIFIKNIYNENNTLNSNTFNYTNLDFFTFDIRSKSKDFTFEIDYEAEEKIILQKKIDFYTDLKYINRKFTFSENNFFVNQNIFNGTFELDTEWSDKFSTESTLTLENTSNVNVFSKQNYTLLLPTFNSLYHFKDKLDLKFGYSRKILRPNASDLNDLIILLNPGVAKQGNSNLDPQIRNYYFLTLNKSIKSKNFSVKIYKESINNAIADVYKLDENVLVQTLANAASFNSTGINTSLRTKFFKKVIINLNCGLEYNVFEDNSATAIIKKNAGYTFNSSVNLSTTLFKDRVSFAFSGRQNGPEYSLLSKRTNYPYLDLTMSTNFFKNKLNVSLYGRGLLGNNFNGYVDTSNFNGFYQRIEVRNDSSNLLLTLTYNLGKKFDDKIDNNDIDNSDIRK